MKSKLLAFFTCLMLLVTVFFTVACGGGGGSSDDSGATVKPSLCAGFRYETGGKQNMIFAAVNRSGISGFIENANGSKLPGSDLVSNGQANTSEIMVVTSTPGSYKFVYYVNSERFEITRDIQWTTIPDLIAVPLAPEWSSTTKNLSVTHYGLNTGNASYYLRLYYAESLNTMYQQTSTSPGSGVLAMRVNVNGNYVPVLVNDVIEGDELKATIRYIFGVTPLL